MDHPTLKKESGKERQATKGEEVGDRSPDSERKKGLKCL